MAPACLSAQAKPRGVAACNSFVLSDAQAQYITAEHTACKLVDKAIKKGYQGQAVFSAPPGWKCGRAKINTGNNPSLVGTATRGYKCKHKNSRFQFLIV